MGSRLREWSTDLPAVVEAIDVELVHTTVIAPTPPEGHRGVRSQVSIRPL